MGVWLCCVVSFWFVVVLCWIVCFVCLMGVCDVCKIIKIKYWWGV